MVESDSEDDLGNFNRKTTAAATKTKTKTTKETKTAPAKKTTIRDMPAAKRGRPAAAAAAPTTAATASKVTKPATKTAATRRAGERRGAAAAAAALDADKSIMSTTSTTSTKAKRVLADKTNEMAVDAAETTTTAPTTKARGRPGRKAAAPVVADVVESEVEAEAAAEEEAPAPKKRGRGRPKAATNENEDPQGVKPAAKRGRRSAASAIDEDVSMATTDGGDEAANLDDEAEATKTDFADTMEIETIETKTADVNSNNNTFQSPQRRSRPLAAPSSVSRVRGSTTTTTGAGSDDASVRRRLGELTKKHDTLEARYRDLKEIGVKEAERNFDRLKKQGEDRAKGRSTPFPVYFTGLLLTRVQHRTN